MSLELVRESVRLHQLIGEDSTQTIVENDIIVPDIKPDIVRILLLDGEVYVNGTETGTDKLFINGTVRYKILYISDDPDQPLKSITSSSPFRYALDIPDARQGMEGRVKCDIEHLEYEILNSRKISVKAIVSLKGGVSAVVEQQVTRDFEGVEGVQVLRSTVSVNSWIGSSSADCPVLEVVELPAGKPTIREILRCDAKITGKEFRLSEDKIAVRGELNVSTLYIGDDEDRSIQYVEHEIPFAQTLDLSGVDESSLCNISFDLREMSFEPEEDADGELRQLNAEASIGLTADCSGKKELELVDDAYSPNVRMSLEKEQLRMEEVAAENRSQLSLKELVELDDASPNIQEVFNVLAKLSMSEKTVTDDRIILEGVISCNVLYLADNQEQPVFCADREIPFRHVIDVKGVRSGMGTDADMIIENVSYSMVSTRVVELRFAIQFTTRVSNQVSVTVITRAVELPSDDKRAVSMPSITIYFTQQGDTLWKIAKRYYTTVDELRRDNEISNTGQLAPGEQILIPRKAQK